MDKDQSGTLTMPEVVGALQAFNITVPMTIAKQLFDEVDANNDGEIDQAEFLAFLASVKDAN